MWVQPFLCGVVWESVLICFGLTLATHNHAFVLTVSSVIASPHLSSYSPYHWPFVHSYFPPFSTGSLSLMDDDSADVFQPSAVSLVLQSSHPTASSSSRPSCQPTAMTTTAARPVTASGPTSSKQPLKQARSITAPGKVRNRVCMVAGRGDTAY